MKSRQFSSRCLLRPSYSVYVYVRNVDLQESSLLQTHLDEQRIIRCCVNFLLTGLRLYVSKYRYACIIPSEWNTPTRWLKVVVYVGLFGLFEFKVCDIKQKHVYSCSYYIIFMRNKVLTGTLNWMFYIFNLPPLHLHLHFLLLF